MNRTQRANAVAEGLEKARAAICSQSIGTGRFSERVSYALAALEESFQGIPNRTRVAVLLKELPGLVELAKTEAEAYNGHPNYETWHHLLALENDEGTYHHWSHRAQELAEDADPEDFDDEVELARFLRTSLATELKAEHENACCDVANIPVTMMEGNRLDIVNTLHHCHEDIDWDHVADSFLEAVADA